MMSAVTRQLVALIKGQIPDITEEVEWEFIIRVARQSSVLPRLSAIFLENQEKQLIPAYPLAHLSAAKRTYELLVQQVHFEGDELVRLVNQVSSEKPIFLKGAAYQLAGYKVSEGRVFSDIDILVMKNDIERIENKLLVYGWIHDDIDEYEQMYYRQWAHEIPPLMHCSRGTLLDVHHNLVPIISGKAPNIDLFKNDLVDICDGKAKTLASYSMTLHSAIHLFYQEEYHHGFRDLADLHLMFSEFGQKDTFWENLFDLAEKSDFTHELGLACRYTKMIFDSPIPESWMQKSQSFLPSSISLFVLDWVYQKVLQPQHPLCGVSKLGLANFIAMIRGHWIKMPLPVLIRHISHKVYTGLIEIIAGKGALKKATEDDGNSPDNIRKI